MDTAIVSTITAHAPGYIDQALELVAGLQTDKPLKRALMPFGGIRVAEDALAAYGYEIAPEVRGFSPNTARRIMKACSTPIRPGQESSQGGDRHGPSRWYGADASSAIIAASRFTERRA
jgi:hypothetical protein